LKELNLRQPKSRAQRKPEKSSLIQGHYSKPIIEETMDMGPEGFVSSAGSGCGRMGGRTGFMAAGTTIICAV
jgi:hypothetical protein